MLKHWLLYKYLPQGPFLTILINTLKVLFEITFITAGDTIALLYIFDTTYLIYSRCC